MNELYHAAPKKYNTKSIPIDNKFVIDFFSYLNYCN